MPERGWQHRRPRFEEQLLPWKKTVLALLKVGLPYPEIRDMSESQAEGWLTAYNQLMSPEKKKSYVVKRKKGKR